MENQKVGKEAPSPSTPASKQRSKLLVVFWAIIFWASTLFLVGHPFLFGLQYTIYIIPAYAILFKRLQHYKISVLPYQQRIISSYKKSFIYKLLYVNNSYEKGSKKELTFRQCRGMVYFHLLFSFIAFSIIFFYPIKNERKTFYEEGYVVDLKKIPTLSLCGNSILTIINKDGKERKIYLTLTDKRARLIELNVIYTFEIDFARRSPVYMCRKYDHLYTLQKNNEILIGKLRSPERSKKNDIFIFRIIIFFVSIAAIFLLSLFFSYRERNRVQ